MIYKDSKEIAIIYYGTKTITAIYKGGILIWQAIKSCFGSGVWVSRKPWLGKEKWKY